MVTDRAANVAVHREIHGNLGEVGYAFELLASTDLASNLRFAYLHKDIIARFGRFPHRNAVLGRVNTPDERVFLQNPHAGF